MSNHDRVLLVDDNLTNLQVLYQALEEEGYELYVAQSGEEALVTAEETQPQLVLLDINMPGIDGYETCQRLRTSDATKDSVVIFLSARNAVDDKVQGLDLGAVDYIEKPFQFEEVVARVRKHLDAYHERLTLKNENKKHRYKYYIYKMHMGFFQYTINSHATNPFLPIWIKNIYIQYYILNYTLVFVE